MKTQLIRRISDGAMFEPSWPDYYTSANALVDAMLGERRYYFRRIRPVKKRFWHVKQRWERTSEIWEPKDENEFEIL